MILPELRSYEGSWMVVPRVGEYKAVCEIHRDDAHIARQVNTAKYVLVPVSEYLHQLSVRPPADPQ